MRPFITATFIVALLPAGLGPAGKAGEPNVRLVHPLGDDSGNTCISTPCRTIGRAIEVAVPSDIVDIAAGEYTEVLTIDKSLTLQGGGQDNVTIVQAREEPGEADGRVITLSGGDLDVTISDLVIRYGFARDALDCIRDPGPDCQGGGLRNSGNNLMLANVTFQDNRATLGGGLYSASQGHIELAGVVFENNVAMGALDSLGLGGGVLNADGSSINAENVRFAGNVSDSGGGMHSRGSAELVNVHFTGNVAAQQGGGLFNSLAGVSGRVLALTGVTFDDNSARQGGGAYFLESSSTLAGVTFNNNQAIAGGGINVAGDGNYAPLGDITILRGGGLYNDGGSPELSDVTFEGNSAVFAGGGMYTESGSPVMHNVDFIVNRTTISASHGGGMYNEAGDPELVDVNFRGNIAEAAGGGMTNDAGAPTLTNVMFSGNTAQTGGGMHNLQSAPVLTNVVFSGNRADGILSVCVPGGCNGRGGGIANRDSVPRLTNVTFSGNRASGEGGAEGGGMFSTSETTLIDATVIRNSVFWNNMDDTGIGTSGASISIAGAAPSPVIQFSLVQGLFPPGNGNLDGTDAGNDPLFLNMPDPESAPTLAGNLRLFPESLVIDVGNNAFVDGVDTDLDGNPRIIGPAVDLGPYEFTGEIDDVIFRDRFEHQ